MVSQLIQAGDVKVPELAVTAIAVVPAYTINDSVTDIKVGSGQLLFSGLVGSAVSAYGDKVVEGLRNPIVGSGLHC